MKRTTTSSSLARIPPLYSTILILIFVYFFWHAWSFASECSSSKLELITSTSSIGQLVQSLNTLVQSWVAHRSISQLDVLKAAFIELELARITSTKSQIRGVLDALKSGTVNGARLDKASSKIRELIDELVASWSGDSEKSVLKLYAQMQENDKKTLALASELSSAIEHELKKLPVSLASSSKLRIMVDQPATAQRQKIETPIVQKGLKKSPNAMQSSPGSDDAGGDDDDD